MSATGSLYLPHGEVNLLYPWKTNAMAFFFPFHFKVIHGHGAVLENTEKHNKRVIILCLPPTQENSYQWVALYKINIVVYHGYFIHSTEIYLAPVMYQELLSALGIEQ